MGEMQSFALPRATGSLERGSHGISSDSSGSFECAKFECAKSECLKSDCAKSECAKSECAKCAHGPSGSLVN